MAWGGVPQAKREKIFLLWQAQETGMRRPRRGKCLGKYQVLYVNSMPFLRKSIFFSIRCNENVSSSPNHSKLRGGHELVKWHVGGDWQWKFGGEHGVWAEGKKAHVKHHWKEASQEKVMRQHSTEPVRAASKCCALVHKKKKKRIQQTNKQKIANVQRATDEKPFLFELDWHSWNSVTSY